MEHIGKFTSRLLGIQSLRGLGVLFVMSVHLYEVERKYTLGPRLLDNWTHFFMIGVDFFLIISGLVLTLLAFGYFGDRHYLKRFTYARVTRVYPVYLLFTLAVLPVFLWQPGMFNSSEGSNINLLRSLLMLPDVNLPLIPVAWTLHHEAYFYLVFGFMLLLPQRELPKAMFLWFMATMVLIGMGLLTPRAEQGGFERVLYNPINLEFLLGMVLAWWIGQGRRDHAYKALGLGVAWWVIGHLLYFQAYGVHWIDDHWRIPALGIPAALMTYGIVAMELRDGRVLMPMLVKLGDAAYSIYLSHLLTMSLVGKIWRMLGIEGWIPHLLFLAIATAVAIGVGMVAYQVVERPLMRWFRRYEPPPHPTGIKQAT